MRPPPRDQLDPRARTLWQLSGLIFTVIMVIIVVAVALFLIRVAGAPPEWIIGLGAVTVLATATSIWPIPALQWRFWRYEIGEQEVDLQRGWLVVTRTLIPMAQIQHVDTRRGPLERRFGLATVVLYTAAGSNEIPALDDEVAGEVRDRIAGLANLNQQL